jgi:hypothetical protein
MNNANASASTLSAEWWPDVLGPMIEARCAVLRCNAIVHTHQVFVHHITREMVGIPLCRNHYGLVDVMR